MDPKANVKGEKKVKITISVQIKREITETKKKI
jgi:hypothetical protein